MNNKTIKTSDIIAKSFCQLVDNKSLLMTSTLVFMLLALVSQGLDYAMVSYYNNTVPTFPAADVNQMQQNSAFYRYLSTLLILPFSACISCGIAKVFLELNRTGEINLSNMIKPFDRMFAITGAAILYHLAYLSVIAIGGLGVFLVSTIHPFLGFLVAVPSVLAVIYAWCHIGCLSFFDLIILEHNESAINSLRKSYRLARPFIGQVVWSWIAVSLVIVAVGMLLWFVILFASVMIGGIYPSLLAIKDNLFLSMTAIGLMWFVFVALTSTLRSAFYSGLYREVIGDGDFDQDGNR